MHDHQSFSTNQARRAIEGAWPSLNVEHICPIHPGWDSLVFLVNNQYVFRFPLRSEVASALSRECELLPLIAESTRTPVPRFEIVVPPSDDFPFLFVGYRLLPGEPLRDLSGKLDSNAGAAVASQIGDFLRRLHRMRFEPGLEAGLEPFDPNRMRERRLAVFTGALDAVEAQLGAGVAMTIRDYLLSLLTQIDWAAIRPAMTHGDLGAEHILVDSRNDHRVSIIDFGDLCFDDPAPDLAGIPDELLPAVVEQYRMDLGDDFPMRRALYQALVPAYAIEAGERLDRPDLVREGINGYRRLARGLTSG